MKNSAMSREWSLWNQLQLGYSKFKIDNNMSEPQKQQQQQLNSSHLADDEKKKLQSYYDPEALASQYYENKQQSKKTNKRLTALGLTALFSYILYLSYAYFIRDPKSSESLDTYYLNHHFKLLEESDLEPSPEVHEVIEIPIIPALNYSTPLYSQVLLTTTFGNTWGHPAVVTYNAPKNITFNQVVVSLDTTVDGVQYDRLAHLYLDGAELWRTSTIEPSGNLSHSFAQKDLSMYAKLFQSDGTLMFQLDNLLTPRLTGSFNVTLKATYYYDIDGPDYSLFPTDGSEDDEDTVGTMDIGDEILPGSLRTIFSTREVADQVYPLVKAASLSRPPLVYIPDSPFASIVPQLNGNTTKAKLIIYISGNAAEEFWYSNVFDEYQDFFLKRGHHFEGHGPCRMINVFVDDFRVASVNPNPTIFTGGVAPSLWNPIVSSGAFDIRGLEVDLTAILPLLWEKDSQISIEVSNCIDDDPKKKGKKASGVGSNWISSANVITWEDERIANSTGEIIAFDNATKIFDFAIAPPFGGLLTQIVRADYGNMVNSTLNYTLTNGTELSYNAQSSYNSSQASVGVIVKFGDTQKIVSDPKSFTSFVLTDALTELPVSNVTYNFSYPLDLKIDTLPVVGATVEYQVNITKEFKGIVAADGLPFISIKNMENGTANFTISPDGNFGNGSVEHNYTLTENLPGGVLAKQYNRHALGANKTIEYDNVTISTVPAFTKPKDVFGKQELKSLAGHHLTRLRVPGDMLEDMLEMLNDLQDESDVARYMDFFSEAIAYHVDAAFNRPEDPERIDFSPFELDTESVADEDMDWPLARPFVMDY